jgi:nicotinate-nucleotide adenylyltransferase
MASLGSAGTGVCGILGGTFDPVHLGHVALADAALHELPLGEVLWLPSGSPGHRAPPAAGAEHRLAMLRLATAGNPRFRIDAAELGSDAPTYTVNTLTRLRAKPGAAQPLVLLLGADSFLSLPSWLRWRELFDLAHIAVADRPGHAPAPGAMAPELAQQFERRLAPAQSLCQSPAGAVVRFDMPQHDISASAIRSAIAAGTNVQHLLAHGVLAYIEKHHLYRKETHSP